MNCALLEVDFSQRNKDLRFMVKNTRKSDRIWRLEQWKIYFALKRSNDGYWQGLKHALPRKNKTVILQFSSIVTA